MRMTGLIHLIEEQFWRLERDDFTRRNREHCNTRETVVQYFSRMGFGYGLLVAGLSVFGTVEMMKQTSLVLLAVALMVSWVRGESEKPKPLMKDFMGLNVHSKAFEPGPFRPVCEMVRDYHNLVGDVGKDPATPTRFPKGAAAEGEGWLNWDEMYGSWVAAGFRIDAC